ncbi:MAG: hypothetical protein ABFS16_16310, partial [Bacteroidota bacterium]
MKTNIKLNQRIINVRTVLLALCIGLVFSCEKETFLDEVPLDFYAPANSYKTFENFEAAIFNLYRT